MHTLFLGNLPQGVSEENLRELFRRIGVDVITIEVRRGGIAFARCPNQNSADRAIEVLNGHQMCGFAIRVEPSMPRQKIRTFIDGKTLDNHGDSNNVAMNEMVAQAQAKHVGTVQTMMVTPRKNFVKWNTPQYPNLRVSSQHKVSPNRKEAGDMKCQ